MNDAELLANLGLTEDNSATEATTVDTAAPADEAEPKTKATRTEIKITGEIATTVRKGLPPQARNGFGGGKRGSKYPFESLVAPVEVDGEYEYSNFTVKLTDVENADAKKLQGAIQAAVAAQNKQAKEAGSEVYYVSRTETGDNGEYVGSTVYRVDQTLGADAE